MTTLSDYLYSKAARVGSAVALAATLVAGVSVSPAAAQGRYDGYYDRSSYNDRNDRRLSTSDIRRIAMVNGYSEGFEHGIHDRRDRAGFNYQHSDGYRRATSGYEGEWRAPRDYQNAFRQGYSKGYSDGYYGRARNGSYDRGRGYSYRNGSGDPYGNYPSYGRNPYGNNGAYYNGRYYDNRRGDLNPEEIARRAAQQGYYDGFQRGQYDLRIGARQPKPTGHGAYQTAFNGWNPEWGSALTFQQYYRQYFIQGYQDGFGRRQMNRQYSRRWW
jgi:hypothetical protein